MFNSNSAAERIDGRMVSDGKSDLFDGEVSSELTSPLSDNQSPAIQLLEAIFLLAAAPFFFWISYGYDPIHPPT